MTSVPDVPAEIERWVDQTRYEETADFPVERGYIWTSCASVENGNPLFWDDAVATDLADGPIAPPTTLSLWFRPHAWEPGETVARQPLQIHFDLKEQLGLPEAVMTDSQVVFRTPVRPGDVISTAQVLRSISEPKTTKLGSGRFWVIDVDYRNQDGAVVGTEIFTGFGYRRAATTVAAGEPQAAPGTAHIGKSATVPAATRDTASAVPEASRGESLVIGKVAAGDELPPLEHQVTATTVVLGALATRDWRPMHHDVDFAVNRNGAKDIFLNTPNQQAWFERYITDWTGPKGRLGRLRFRMRDSVYPGDTMRLSGTVDGLSTDSSGCGWVDVTVDLHAQAPDGAARLATTCTARVALPTSDDDNPWRRDGDTWQP
jgi:acyl dehydratase